MRSVTRDIRPKTAESAKVGGKAPPKLPKLAQPASKPAQHQGDADESGKYLVADVPSEVAPSSRTHGTSRGVAKAWGEPSSGKRPAPPPIQRPGSAAASRNPAGKELTVAVEGAEHTARTGAPKATARPGGRPAQGVARGSAGLGKAGSVAAAVPDIPPNAKPIDPRVRAEMTAEEQPPEEYIARCRESRVIRVYVALPPRDFGPDRDALFKTTFPRLANLCRSRGYSFLPVDVSPFSEKDQNRQTLLLRLREISNSRPYFMALMGNMYGHFNDLSNPDAAVDPALMDTFDTAGTRFPWVHSFKDRSLAEMEILYGALARRHKDVKRTFFYVRSPEVCRTLPAPSETSVTMSSSSSGPTGHGVRRAGAGRPSDAESPAAGQRQEALKQGVLTAGYAIKNLYVNTNELADKAYADLERAILADFPEEVPRGWAEEERACHEAYGAFRVGPHYVPRDVEGLLEGYVEAPSNGKPFLLLGARGSGKTATLANWAARWRQLRSTPDDAVVMHHCDCTATPSAASLVPLLRRLAEEMVEFGAGAAAARRARQEAGELARSEWDEERLSSTPEDASAKFTELLQRCGNAVPPQAPPARPATSHGSGGARGALAGRKLRGKLVLVVDSVDLLEGGVGSDLRWIPEAFPSNVYIVLSARPGTAPEAAARAGGWLSVGLGPLHPQQRISLVDRLMGPIDAAADEADNRARERLMAMDSPAASGAAGAAWLSMLTRECRRRRGREVESALDEMAPAKDAPALLDALLARWEREYGLTTVQISLTLMATSLVGLPEWDILEIAQLRGLVWAPFSHALREFAFAHRGALYIGEPLLREAVVRRYLTPEPGATDEPPPVAKVHDDIAARYEQQLKAERAAAAGPGPGGAPPPSGDGRATAMSSHSHRGLGRGAGDGPAANSLEGALSRAAAWAAGPRGAWRRDLPFHLAQIGSWRRLAAALADPDVFGSLWEHGLRRDELSVHWRALLASFASSKAGAAGAAPTLSFDTTTDEARPLTEADVDPARAYPPALEGYAASHFDVEAAHAAERVAAFLIAFRPPAAADDPLLPAGEHAGTEPELAPGCGLRAAPAFLPPAVHPPRPTVDDEEGGEKRPSTSRPPRPAAASGLAAAVFSPKAAAAAASRLLERAVALRTRAFGPTALPVAASFLALAGGYLAECAVAAASPPPRRPAPGPAPPPPPPGTAPRPRGPPRRRGPRGAPPPVPATPATAFRSPRELRPPRGDDALAASERSLDLRVSALGVEHEAIADALDSVARSYRAKGNLSQAFIQHMKAVDITEKLYGPKHRKVALRLLAVARVYRETGQLRRALGVYRRALAIQEESSGPGHAGVGDTLHTMGQLTIWCGDPEGAQPLLERALRIRQRALGQEHGRSGETLQLIADLYRATGRVEAALPLYLASQRILERVLGPHHPAVGERLVALADHHFSLGHYDHALPYYQRALDIGEAHVRAVRARSGASAAGPDVQLALASLMKAVAWIHAFKGRQGPEAAHRLEDAEILYRRAVALQEQVLGPEAPDVAGTLFSLAELLVARVRVLAQGDKDKEKELQNANAGGADEPVKLMQRALQIRETAFGPLQEDLTPLLCALGDALLRRDRVDEAYPCFERALRLTERATQGAPGAGPHPAVAARLYDVARCLRSKRRYADGVALLERALAILHQTAAVPTITNSLASALAPPPPPPGSPSSPRPPSAAGGSRPPSAAGAPSRRGAFAIPGSAPPRRPRPPGNRRGSAAGGRRGSTSAGSRRASSAGPGSRRGSTASPPPPAAAAPPSPPSSPLPAPAATAASLLEAAQGAAREESHPDARRCRTLLELLKVLLQKQIEAKEKKGRKFPAPAAKGKGKGK
eukprot:tig00020912_g15863.t1